MTVPHSLSDAFDQLHADARAATGLNDFGEVYREGLQRLLKAMDDDACLTPEGREFAYGTILDTLTSRLYTEQAWKGNPDYRTNVIRRPLVIIGIPRTGTTALHKLLAMDTQFQGLDRWIANAPMVRPPRDTWPSNPRYRAEVARLEAYFESEPGMRAAHEMVADEVDECYEVLKQTLVHNTFSSMFQVPSYDEWMLEQDQRPAYQRYGEVLKLIGNADRDKPWLLKNPCHFWHLELLLEVFPDARIVQTHRDPVKAIPSLCSVLTMSRQMSSGENTDPTLLGPREIKVSSTGIERVMKVREQCGDQVMDVLHRDFHADPMGVVRQIYQRFGFTLSPEAKAAMKKWIAANPSDKHGEHRYDIGRFGISENEIRERFGDYISRFDLA